MEARRRSHGDNIKRVDNEDNYTVRVDSRFEIATTYAQTESDTKQW